MNQGSAGMGGKLIFLVTFLIGYLTTGIRGDGHLQRPTATNVSITRDGCGSTKLCLGDVGCDPAGNVLCSFISSEVVNASTSDVKFELFGNSTGYIALVLTTNVDQGGGLVFVCSRDPFNATRNFFFRTATQIGNNGSITLTNSPRVEDITYNFNRSINGSFHQCTFTAQGLSQAINNRTSGALNFQAGLVSGKVNADGTFEAPSATLFRTNGSVDLTNLTGNSPDPPAFDPAANLETPTATMVSITRDGCGSTKLCLGDVGCDPAGNVLCSFISSEVVNASTSDVKFELFGNSTGYIALVLTTNVDQGGGLVFVCSRDPFNATRNFLFRTATQIGNNGSITLTNSPRVEDITYNFNRSINGSFHQCTFTAQGLSQAINNRASGALNFQAGLVSGKVNADGTFEAPSATLFRTNGSVDLTNLTGNSPDPPAFDPAANLETPTATMVSITRDGCGSTKLCLGDVGCDPAGNVLCSFISSEVVNASTSDVKFELFGNSTGYIALVLTTNVDQGGGLVFVCSRDPFNATRNFLFRTATQIGNNGSITLTNSPRVEDITYNFNRSINGSFHQCTFTAQGLSQAINNRASGALNFQAGLVSGKVNADGTFEAPSATLFRTNGSVDLTNLTGNSPDPPAFDPAANLETPTATMVSITRDGCGSTKLCLGDVGCDPAGNVLCSFISSEVVNASTSGVKFELFGNSTGYIALVLTTNVDQGGGLVFVCSRDPFNATRNFLFRTATQIGNNGSITLTNSPRVEDITYNFNRSINGSFHQCTFTAQGLSQAINNRASGALNFQAGLVSGKVNADGTFEAPSATLFRTNGSVDLTNLTGNSPDRSSCF
ncbi:uncharacterized protein LOC143133825 isoform X1 [Alosa pseudoharengus]|uniref:uncharacterized protein LOC143133825 isoform X1 n=2 Tax=Alosa pseudoharengus TaxID=34774 RepID=UPI003F8ADBCE